MLKREKPEKLEEIKKLVEQYKTIGVLDMHKLPAGVLLKVRNNLKGVAVVKMSGKSIIERSLKETKRGEGLVDKIKGPPALILSNENPFRLFALLKKNRAAASAKLGDVVANDVVIKKGPTGIAPGPAISTLQKVGLKTRVEGGKIAVSDDKVIIKAGEKVNEDAVAVLSLLKIQPIEIGMTMVAAWDGTVYDREILDVDVEQYLAEIQSCVGKAINLSVNTDYPTSLTIEIMLSKAFSEARNLCIEAGVFEKEIIGDVLAKAAMEMKALKDKINFQEV